LTVESSSGSGTVVAWEIPAERVATTVSPARGLYRDWRPPNVGTESRTPRAQFDALVEGMSDVVSCFDRSLRHVYVNPAIETATGIPRARFIGMTNRDLGMPVELADQWDAALHRVFVAGEAVDQVFTYDTPAGARTFHATLVPEFEGQDIVHAWSVVRDLTTLIGPSTA
jgi:PAS domain S-box-containing protein